MKTRDVMTRNVVTTSPDATIVQAARLMLQNNISGLPVVDATEKLVGIVTEGDFVRRSEIGTQHKLSRWIGFLLGPGKLADDYVHASGRRVDEVMTTDLQTITEDTALDRIVELMERHHVKRFPVLRDDKLVGIVTRANLMRALVDQSPKPTDEERDDALVRRRLLAELRKQPWAPLALVDVTVTDGVLKYSGCITDERQRQAMKVAAENIPGVKAIEDDLIWVEPMSGMAFGASKH